LTCLQTSTQKTSTHRDFNDCHGSPPIRLPQHTHHQVPITILINGKKTLETQLNAAVTSITTRTCILSFAAAGLGDGNEGRACGIGRAPLGQRKALCRYHANMTICEISTQKEELAHLTMFAAASSWWRIIFFE